MRIRQCDRCNRSYEPYEDKFNNIGTRTYNMDNESLESGTDYDLCPQCREEFIEWFNAAGAVVNDSPIQKEARTLKDKLREAFQNPEQTW